MYLYNPKRHTLHIEGYCAHSKGIHPDYIRFDTEDAVLTYDGRAVGLCKICQKEREKRLEEIK